MSAAEGAGSQLLLASGAMPAIDWMSGASLAGAPTATVWTRGANSHLWWQRTLACAGTGCAVSAPLMLHHLVHPPVTAVAHRCCRAHRARR
eukprot:SAG11_NODE_1259_length_5357_cov_34.538227_2_plen_91_part_00